MKILFDLSQTSENSTGIQGDLKLTLKALLKGKDNQVDGMWYDQKDNLSALQFEDTQGKSRVNRLSSESKNVYNFFNFLPEYKLFKLFVLITYLYKIYFKKKFKLIPIGLEFENVMYQKFFKDDMVLSSTANYKMNQLFFCNLSKRVFSHRLQLNQSLPMPRIINSDHQIVICQTEIPIEFDKHVLKVIRVHDLIPLLNPDTVSGSLSASKLQYFGIQKNLNQNTIFVANSEHTKSKLLQFFPELSARCFVINCPINDCFIPVKKDINIIRNIIKFRESKIFVKEIKFDRNHQIASSDEFHYLLISGTIEPRKNHIQLIQAFTEIITSNNFKKPLKLIIVGKFGWKYDNIIKYITPLVKKGHLFVLDNVSNFELNILYSNAKCFVFPSIAEGFGIPPLEAMSCQVPVISSDIDVHREIQGDAPFYVDPYDVNALVSTLNYILDHQNSNVIHQKVLLGIKQAEKYKAETILKSWEELFKIAKKRNYKFI